MTPPTLIFIFRNYSLAGLIQSLSDHMYTVSCCETLALRRLTFKGKYKQNLGQGTLAVNILFKLEMQEKYQLLKVLLLTVWRARFCWHFLSWNQTPGLLKCQQQKPVTSGNERSTVCSAMAIKTCPAHKTVWGRWIFRHMFLETKRDLFRRRPMTSTKTERPGGLHPRDMASVNLLEPAHKGAHQNLHLSRRNNALASCFSLENQIFFPNVMLQAG